MLSKIKQDLDPLETEEWLDSFESIIYYKGVDRAEYIINRLLEKAKNYNLNIKEKIKKTDYINTIPIENQPNYPGDMFLEKKIRSAVRWNALMIVLRAYRKGLDLGGHISSFQSSVTLYEVCFNHFFKAERFGGDLIYFQGHISPGIYARAFLEGRLKEKQMDNFRQEVNGDGLSSYPHPRLMKNFWQFPTVSMGLGALNSMYQAKFLKYIENRGLKNTKNQTVYAFLGDGEMDEPESRGAISIAVREKLDNLVFVINCNLQRLDGPVFGHGKIINELESVFKGAGWFVIKVLWGSGWDKLFHNDTSGKLVQLMNETLDGEYQRLRSKNGTYIRENFFNRYIETKKLVQFMSDEEIWSLNRGGHDPKKIYAAFDLARKVKGKPTVILFKTIKGYGMGDIAESKNIAHQIKNMNLQAIRYFRDKFNIPILDKNIQNLPFFTFKKDSEEYKYLHKRRQILGGFLPSRKSKFIEKLRIPSLEQFKDLLKKQEKKISTTIAFVRFLNFLLKCSFIKDNLLIIIADEARTFGMEGLFRKIGIYNSSGQLYLPQDKEQLVYYKEDKKGQILQEGISELGAGSSWLAAATSYSTSNLPIIPFYIYYSIFGFQRIGDLFWLAGDQQARGFLIGGTSGRTTLNGEGLQHQDGHSHIQSLTIPNCISYDPAYAYELVVIIQNGIKRMYGKKQENIYYYITTLNENYSMPKIPLGVEEGICKGIYKIKSLHGKNGKIQLLGSGALVRHVLKAGKILSNEYDIQSDIYSVTSFTELARNGQDCDRWNMLHPNKKPRIPYINKILDNTPVIASTDYMKLFAEQIRPFLKTNRYKVLGTDGFGMSDSRKNLRYHFEISSNYIVIAALTELEKIGKIGIELIQKGIKKYKINPEKLNPRLI